MNWYAYAGNNPVRFIDPYGLAPYNNWGDFKARYGGGMGGASAAVDTYLLGGSTQHYGNTAGLYDAGLASRGDLYRAGANWARRTAVAAVALEQLGAGILNAIGNAVAPHSGATCEAGAKVYRAYGGEAGAYGSSWTPVNPADVADYRTAAGLPPGNSGRFVIEGVLNDASGVVVKSANPIPGTGAGGGLPEWVIPNPQAQVTVTGVYGVNPPL